MNCYCRSFLVYYVFGLTEPLIKGSRKNNFAEFALRFGSVWLIRESKTTGIASYFADFASEVSAKDGLKLRCKNVKLFLREP